jgi:hypothetical protein
MSRKSILAAVASCLGAATVALTSAAPAAAATRSFKVYNFSSHPIRFDDSSGDFSGGRPDPGSILNPGAGYHDFELTYTISPLADSGTAHYSILNNGNKIGEFWPHMLITTSVTNAVYCTLGPSSPGQCDPAASSANHATSGTTQTYLDPPGTVHNVPADQAQAQADLLHRLCADDNLATCKFTPTSETEIDGPPHPVGRPVENKTDEEQSFSVEAIDTASQSNSVGIDVKVGGKLFNVIDLAVTGHYEHTWTTEHTFSQEEEVRCRAHYKCWVEFAEPMLRDTGDFTVKLGNTTWNLPGVYFDSPDPKRSGVYRIVDAPLTGEQLSRLPRRFRAPKVLRSGPAGHHRYGRVARPRLHLALYGPRALRPGQAARYRVRLWRSEPARRPTFVPGSVIVTVTAGGRRVGHRVFDTLSIWQARSTRLALRAPTRGRVCIAVQATAIHARGATARQCATVAPERSHGGRG